MSIEQNKAVIRRFYDEFHGKRDLAVADEIIATDFILDNPLTHGREAFKQGIIALRSAFPDMQVAYEDMIAEEDKVACRWIVRGTHRGEFQGIAPTGRQVTMTGISIFRMTGGNIAESWNNFDGLGLMQQLGVIPVPKQTER